MNAEPSAAPSAVIGRRGGPGLLLAIAWPLLKLFCLAAARRRGEPGTLLAFQAYQVGDLYMALPALELLARHARVTVACRPGCEGVLRARGFDALPFPHPAFASSAPSAWVAGLKAAWALRGRASRCAEALDLNGDPRTAVMLKAAGCARTVSYRRPFAWCFDETFPAAPAGPRQGDKDWAVAAAWLARKGVPVPPRTLPAPAAAASGPLLLACWTRKPEKNWPLGKWDAVLEWLSAEERSFAVLDAPDGDAAFAAFRSRWAGRARFLSADLAGIEAAVRDSAGVIGLDNFLGHMAASLGKPVLWINGSSDPDLVVPDGPATSIVQVDPMPCRPCGHRCVNPVHLQCLRTLEPDAVLSRLKAGWPAAGA